MEYSELMNRISHNQVCILEEMNDKGYLKPYDLAYIENVDENKVLSNLNNLKSYKLIEETSNIQIISLTEFGENFVKYIKDTIDASRSKRIDKYFGFYKVYLNDGIDTSPIESVFDNLGVSDYQKIYAANSERKNIWGMVATHSSIEHGDIIHVFRQLNKEIFEPRISSFTSMSDWKLSKFYEMVTGRKLRREGLVKRDYDFIEDSLRLHGNISFTQLELLNE